MKKGSVVAQIALVFLALIVFEFAALAATINTRRLTRDPKKSKSQISENAHARKRMSRLRRSRGKVVRARKGRRARHARHRRHRYYERFYTSSYSDELTGGDVTAGEDPVVRAAAIDALGNMNGTVVAIEPTSGRILAIVSTAFSTSSSRASMAARSGLSPSTIGRG